MGVFRWMFVAGVLAALGGCCPCGRTTVGQLPAAITVEEQARRLTEWSKRLPRIEATTVMGGVGMEYQDDKGRGHAVNAEGTLRIQQHWETATSSVPAAADVLLTGRSFDQPAFEAGRNATHWWFAVKVEQKEAWVGSATRPVDFGTLGQKDSANILRADLVPDLLGLSALPDISAGGSMASSMQAVPSPIVTMLVNDDAGTNEIYVMPALSHWGGYSISRQIIVDRRSGHITEVRMYDAAGVVAVRSALSDYAPVTYGEGVAKPGVAPEFPRRVVVKYPGRALTVSLKFDDVEVPGEFPAVVFAMPDFEKMGLKVMAGD